MPYFALGRQWFGDDEVMKAALGEQYLCPAYLTSQHRRKFMQKRKVGRIELFMLGYKGAYPAEDNSHVVENPVECLHSVRSSPLPFLRIMACSFFLCSMRPQDAHRWLPRCPLCRCTMWQRGHSQEVCWRWTLPRWSR